jgi:hypothetical protein
MAMQKKEKIWEGAAGAAGGGMIGPEAAPVTLGLFLLPGRHLARAADDDPVTAGEILLLFLLPRGRPRPRGATGEPRCRREPSASAMWTKEKPTKTLEGERRWGGGERIWLGFHTLTRRSFIYKHLLLGPCAKVKPVNIFYNRSQFLHTADDNTKEKTMVAQYESLDLG